MKKGEIFYGFWVGLGLLMAFAVWHLVSYLMARVAGSDGR